MDHSNYRTFLNIVLLLAKTVFLNLFFSKVSNEQRQHSELLDYPKICEVIWRNFRETCITVQLQESQPIGFFSDNRSNSNYIVRKNGIGFLRSLDLLESCLLNLNSMSFFKLGQNMTSLFGCLILIQEEVAKNPKVAKKYENPLDFGESLNQQIPDLMTELISHSKSSLVRLFLDRFSLIENPIETIENFLSLFEIDRKLSFENFDVLSQHFSNTNIFQTLIFFKHQSLIFFKH